MSRNQRTAIDQIEWMRNLLAFLLVGAFVCAVVTFTFVPIPKQNEQLITYMIGQLSGMALTALGFYFVNKVGQDALDAKRADNTANALDTIKEVAKNTGSAGGDEGAIREGDDVKITKTDDTNDKAAGGV